MLIRPFAHEDAVRIKSFPESDAEIFFFFPSARLPLTEGQIINSAENRLEPTVAEVNGIVAGFGNIIAIRNHAVADIGNLMVDPLCRGKGIGKAIIKSLANTARLKYQANTMRASCFNENTPGFIFYDRLGFQPVSMTPRKDPDNRPVMLIHLEIRISDLLTN